jgi:hypothetical protein
MASQKFTKLGKIDMLALKLPLRPGKFRFKGLETKFVALGE